MSTQTSLFESETLHTGVFPTAQEQIINKQDEKSLNVERWYSKLSRANKKKLKSLIADVIKLAKIAKAYEDKQKAAVQNLSAILQGLQCPLGPLNQFDTEDGGITTQSKTYLDPNEEEIAKYPDLQQICYAKVFNKDSRPFLQTYFENIVLPKNPAAKPFLRVSKRTYEIRVNLGRKQEENANQ